MGRDQPSALSFLISLFAGAGIESSTPWQHVVLGFFWWHSFKKKPFGRCGRQTASQLTCLASILIHHPRTLHEQHTCLGQPGFITENSFLAELPERLPRHTELARVQPEH